MGTRVKKLTNTYWAKNRLDRAATGGLKLNGLLNKNGSKVAAIAKAFDKLKGVSGPRAAIPRDASKVSSGRRTAQSSAAAAANASLARRLDPKVIYARRKAAMTNYHNQ